MKAARRRLTGRRIAVAIVSLLVAYELIATVVDAFTPSSNGSGRRSLSSSYSTAAAGLGAYAELLSDTGHPVTRLRTTLPGADLRPGGTLIVLDPEALVHADYVALHAYLVAGGTLLAGSSTDPAWLGGLLNSPPQWSDSGSLGGVITTTNSPYTAGVSTIAGAGDGVFTNLGSNGTPLISAGEDTILASYRVGAGTLLALADPSPLQNAYLDKADNAALGVALAGGGGRGVTFAESTHGYGAARGLAALPSRWKWALAGLLLAAITLVAAHFRRLGDPDPQEPVPLPPRRVHVEALALALQRTRQPAAAAAPLRDRARQLLIARADLAAEPTPQALVLGAQRLGLDELEARAIAGLDTPTDDEQIVVTGRALAKLSGSAR
jgi:uncharacterized protein DUF4350